MAAIEQKMSAPGFWDNGESARGVVEKLKTLKSVIDPVNDLLKRLGDLRAMNELGVEAGDQATLAEAAAEAAKFAAELERLELRTLLSGPLDAGNCYFSIHAGAGGTESCDWAEMLLRMYLRYFERNGFEASEIDRVDGEEAGVRSVTLHVRGPYAYGYLSCERGPHRLVRISPYDANKRRHTSFAAADVLPELADIEIAVDWDKDVREDTYRSGGAGGQNVNKVSSAIRLTHLATGIVVQCQNERSQHQNRAEARKMLQAKLYQHEQAKRDAELAKMYGQKGEIAFGHQIRSYVLYPYQLVRDERTELKATNTADVLDGQVQPFIDAMLRLRLKQNSAKPAEGGA
jgi:peptide chain release factor 2